MDLLHNFKEKLKDSSVVNVFYEGGSGGEFLVFLLGMHNLICARNFSVDSKNKWTITDDFCRMAGRGLEQIFHRWQFSDEHEIYLSRDHANLLYPTDKWQDELSRSLEDGIKDFNNMYANIWKDSKTIWLDIDTIDDLKFIDTLSAIKNFHNNHVHYTEEEYNKRFIDVKTRLSIKRQRFTGNYITVNVRKLWLENTRTELENIIKYLEIDNSYLDFWEHMIVYWNQKNNNLVCNKECCVPIGL
jgi:hypothetical protein